MFRYSDAVSLNDTDASGQVLDVVNDRLMTIHKLDRALLEKAVSNLEGYS